jgi:hypothetical protein
MQAAAAKNIVTLIKRYQPPMETKKVNPNG